MSPPPLRYHADFRGRYALKPLEVRESLGLEKSRQAESGESRLACHRQAFHHELYPCLLLNVFSVSSIP
jgi:hypothetical protein